MTFFRISLGFRVPLIAFGFLLSVLLPFIGFAQDLSFPKPIGFVNDFAGLLSQSERASLESILQNFERESSNEIVIAIVEDLQETTIEDYANRLFEAWGIGKKKNDNGVLFLVTQKERKVRIEVGYGLEGALPDGKVGEILDREILPEFKRGNFAEGLRNGTFAVIAQTRGEYEPSRRGGERRGQAFINASGILFILGVSFLSWWASFLGRSKRAWPGGIIGALGGGIVGYFLAGLLIALFGFFIFGALGFLFDYIVSKNYAQRRSRGLPTDFWHSGGGFWFGGGRGGGFGGFGGGFSGGGGASRGW